MAILQRRDLQFSLFNMSTSITMIVTTSLVLPVSLSAPSHETYSAGMPIRDCFHSHYTGEEDNPTHMGNTTSIASNMIAFPATERSRRASLATRSAHTEAPDIPGPRYIPATPPFQNALPDAVTPTAPTLSCYRISPRGTQPLHSILHTLCTDLRLQSDRLVRSCIPATDDGGWVPSTVFYRHGNFECTNQYSRHSFSALLTKEHVQTS
jgi:hypothetical protein